MCVDRFNIREWIDHGDDGGLLARAHVVEVEHALDSLVLHAPHDRLGAFGEERLHVVLVDRHVVGSGGRILLGARLVRARRRRSRANLLRSGLVIVLLEQTTKY